MSCTGLCSLKTGCGSPVWLCDSEWGFARLCVAVLLLQAALTPRILTQHCGYPLSDYRFTKMQAAQITDGAPPRQAGHVYFPISIEKLDLTT